MNPVPDGSLAGRDNPPQRFLFISFARYGADDKLYAYPYYAIDVDVTISQSLRDRNCEGVQ
jgi:hypothetical protein